jgi:hypothetical protein
VTTAGGFDRWDLAVRVGPLGSARLRSVAEEHGHGCQLIRFRVWPRWSRGGIAVSVLLFALSALAAARGAVEPAVVLGVLGLGLVAWMIVECGSSIAVSLRTVSDQAGEGSAADLVSDLLVHLHPVEGSGNGKPRPNDHHEAPDLRKGPA